MIVTMQAMKLLLKTPQSRYTMTALTLKKRWKKEASGCLQTQFKYV